MRVLLTLVVCKAYQVVLATAHPVHERNVEKTRKTLHGVGAPHDLKAPAFLDRSRYIHAHTQKSESTHRSFEAGVEAAVRSQRLDSDEDSRTKELSAQLGLVERELEEERDAVSHLNGRLANQEVSFAQKEEKFDAQLAESTWIQKMDDLWVWRLEMGFVTQLVLALVTALACCLCRCQACKRCAPCDVICKNPSNDAKNKWASEHRPMDPELKEKLRIRRLNLDGPGSPEHQTMDGSLAGSSIHAKSRVTEYYSLAEVDAAEEHAKSPQTPRTTAFPAVFTEPRASPMAASPRYPEVQGANTVDQDSWWGTPR